jgi:predicted ATP-dependent serine protease
MYANLNAYVKNKTQKILNIQQTELNGLNGVLGCACEVHGLDSIEEVNGIEETESPVNEIPGVMSSMDFRNVQFKTLGFVGKYRKLIGDPSKGFSVMVYGKPKMGKSFLCVDFAGYLARNHGNVLYVAKEEGLDMTLQDKLKAKDVAHPSLFVAEEIPNDLTPYDFIFFDSVNKLGLSTGDLETLRHNYPTKSFIYIFQTTKEGNFRGANEFQHDVDVVIQVPEKGLAVQNGRFNQGGEMRIFEELEYREAA